MEFLHFKNKAMATKQKTSTKASAPKEEEAPKVRFNTLVVNDDKYRTLLTEKYKNRKKWEEPDFKKILSEIPGTVIKVYVEEGQKVKEGDFLFSITGYLGMFAIAPNLKEAYVNQHVSLARPSKLNNSKYR